MWLATFQPYDSIESTIFDVEKEAREIAQQMGVSISDVARPLVWGELGPRRVLHFKLEREEIELTRIEEPETPQKYGFIEQLNSIWRRFVSRSMESAI